MYSLWYIKIKIHVKNARIRLKESLIVCISWGKILKINKNLKMIKMNYLK